jgi:hypothetical protein
MKIPEIWRNRLAWFALAVAVACGVFFGERNDPGPLIPPEAKVTDLGNGWVRIELRGETYTFFAGLTAEIGFVFPP